MSVPILTAVGDPQWEAELTAGFSHADHGIHVVRRCVDVADVLVVVGEGQVRAVVLSADLRRLDRDAVEGLARARVAIVGMVTAAGDSSERRLRDLGVVRLVGHEAPADVVATAVLAAIAELAEPGALVANAIDPVAAATADLTESAGEGVGSGRIVAVWGPTGAPGRSTIAVNLAAELAALGSSVLLVDADTYGGAVGQLLGVLDESPGIASGCRLATAGSLDLLGLAAVALEVAPSLHVLTGISRPERWSELRPAAIRAVLTLARSLTDYVVVDCGFCVEINQAVSDAAGPHRNATGLAVLESSDLLIGVVAADPIGLARYARALPDALAVAPTATLITVANRLRTGVVGAGEPRRQVRAALERYADTTDVLVVPDDGAAADRALAAGRALAEVAPKSAARLAIRELAERVAGVTPASRRGRRRAS